MVDWTCINNPVLLSLFRMGVLDWTSPNDQLHQATQAIRHSTAMHFRIFPHIMKLEHRVRKMDVGLLDTGGEGAWKPMKTSWVHCRLWLKVPTTYLPITDWVHSKCSQIMCLTWNLWEHLCNIWSPITVSSHLKFPQWHSENVFTIWLVGTFWSHWFVLRTSWSQLVHFGNIMITYKKLNNILNKFQMLHKCSYRFQVEHMVWEHLECTQSVIGG